MKTKTKKIKSILLDIPKNLCKFHWIFWGRYIPLTFKGECPLCLKEPGAF